VKLNKPWAQSFPFPTAREQQIVAIDRAIATFSSGKRFQLLEMGVGCGKSAVAATLAHWTASNSVTTSACQSGAYILTSQKILQDQYERDFSECVSSVKSASAYSCHKFGASCSEANKLFAVLTQAGVPAESCGSTCAYKAAKERFLSSEIGVTNYPFFMNDAVYARDIHKRALMVIDEAHSLEQSLCGLAELRLTSQSVKKLLAIELPKLSSIADVVEWLREAVLSAAADAAEASRAMLKSLVKRDSESREAIAEAKKLDQLMKLLSRIKRVLQLVNDSWVLCDVGAEADSICLRPTDVSAVAESCLFKYASNILLMSATMSDHAVIANALGISVSDSDYVSLPSPFDPANRPIHYVPIGKMSMREADATLPSLIEAVKTILEAHSADKGIVHTGNYKIARALQAAIGSDSRCLFHDDTNRELKLTEHVTSQAPTVLFSPSMTDGVDLHDDLSRFQIICKLPFPNTADPWVKKRCERDESWLAWITASRIAQAVGRSVRHEADWAHTYILDACWKRFLSQNAKFFSESFTRALT